MNAALLATLLLGTAPTPAQTAEGTSTSEGVVITGEREKMERRVRGYVEGAAVVAQSAAAGGRIYRVRY